MQHSTFPASKHRLFSGSRGFSLIELMIVVALVAILSSIALPSYREYVQRSQRTNAKSAIEQVAQWLERGATAQGSYPTTVPAGLLKVEGDQYTLAVVSTTGTTYTITAAPKTGTGQVGDKCGSFILNETGERSVSGASLPSDECWGR